MFRIKFSKLIFRHFSSRTLEVNYENVKSAAGENTNSNISSEWNSSKPFESIPGPKPLPLIGNSWRYYFGDITMQNFPRASEKLHQKYGDICAVRGLGSMPDMIIIYDPNDIEKMYRNEGAWPQRLLFRSFSHYRNVIRKDVYQEVGGLLTVQGEKWFKLRSMVNPILMQTRTALHYVNAMNEVSDDFVNRLNYLKTQNEDGEMPADFSNEINKWSFESVFLIALDKRLGCLENVTNKEAQRMIDYMVEMFNITGVIDFSPIGELCIKFNLPIWKKFVKYEDFFAEVAIKYINEAYEKIQNDKMYSLKTEIEKSAFEKFLEKDKKVALVMTIDMLAAGIDTTGKTMGALLYFLARNKKAQERLRNEIMSLLPNKDSPVTKTVLENAQYLKAAIKETGRLAPIAVSTVRKTVKEMVLGGYQIPIGTLIIVPNLYLSSTEKHYVKAKEFIPERWLRTNTDKYSHKNTHPFVTLHFGFGPRSCVGKRLANLEMEVVAAKIIRNFYLDWPHKDMKFGQDLLYGIQDPLKIRLRSIEN